MTVKELREALEDLDEDLPIVITGGSDHSYHKLYNCLVGNVEEMNRDYYEYYDESGLFEGGKKVAALILDNGSY